MDLLYRQLAAQPRVELRGIVSASGSGGGITPGDTLWTFCFALAAWRIDGGNINQQKLIVRRLATKEQLDLLRAQIKANTIVKLHARVAMQNVYKRPEALLEEIVGEDNSDGELNERLSELLRPVVVSDTQFGDLLLDRSVNTFVGNTTWNGTPVELRFWLHEVEELPAALRHARELWATSKEWNQRVLDCIARDCLPLKSENWREDDGSDVSREQFEARMSLRSITIREDGGFDVAYDDGDLFFGHDIVVMGNVSSKEMSAGIHG